MNRLLEVEQRARRVALARQIARDGTVTGVAVAPGAPLSTGDLLVSVI